MGVFQYKDFDDTTSKELFSDAKAISGYAYHNLGSGFAEGYYNYGYGLGMPLTLVTALIGSTTSQGVSTKLPWNPDAEKQARDKLNEAGWFTISADELGYKGKTDARGTFYGEKSSHSTAQAEVMGKYDADGNLTSIGIAFRGTSGPRESIITDTFGDIINNVLVGLGKTEYSNNYTPNAFGRLLDHVANYAKAHGLAGSDVLVSGHSLGGLAANSMAGSSETKWGGFYSQSNYITFASPSQYEKGNKVLNVGYENDPVFRVLTGTSTTAASVGVHDAPKDSATNNIVNFNDHYASTAWNLLPFSIANLSTWVSHVTPFYQSGMQRVMDSTFYDLTYKDSTIVVSNLSNVTRGNTWVEDLNRNAEKHTGSTFIIGTNSNDLIKGGKGNDYLEGLDGNDIFRDDGGFNMIAGGKGHNTIDLQKSLKGAEIAYDKAGTLYLRDAHGDITIATDISTIRSKESTWLFLTKEVNSQVRADGLHSNQGVKQYANSVTGNDGNDTLTSKTSGSWLFGLEGDDTLIGFGNNNVFVGGEGNDVLKSQGNNNTFLFNGDFGQDIVYGYNKTDKLVFLGTEGSSDEKSSYLDHAKMVDNNVVFTFGQNSVTLVGVSMDSLFADNIILA
ncbi:polyurethanase [Photorhabdus khanii]|uniref:Polyurethanase n=1 Tax=Photorhabdus khanii subsp. guanajuatensis TaxID=2100166 RepID=A0A4R4JEQ7_9GAMM|nr:polyurethanase [Photorhabdus khanii]TDB51279.1 polyurethanase [Photorhabdus khanii subsp. guanajuatensis]